MRKIRQWFCRHDWRMSKYQALVPGREYECTKCDKHVRVY